jgi:hypothetical protein
MIVTIMQSFYLSVMFVHWTSYGCALTYIWISWPTRFMNINQAGHALPSVSGKQTVFILVFIFRGSHRPINMHMYGASIDEK